MSEGDEKRPYAGPGRETTPRQQVPEDPRDVKEYVEEVDEEVPEEDLKTRIADRFANRGDQSDD